MRDYRHKILLDRSLNHEKYKPNFIDAYNDLVVYLSDSKLWEKCGKPNPFLKDDISIEMLFKANMNL